MAEPESESVNEFIPIPKELHSSDNGKMFDHCLVCDKFLLEDGTPYMIEKAVRQIPEMKVTEVIFEYAMCMTCAMRMNESLSKESRERIQAYFARHANFEARRASLLKSNKLEIRPWLQECVIKKTPVSESREYQIVAQCDGQHLLFTHSPFAISLEAMDEITNLLSEKSLGEIDDFMGKYFTGPPEVSEILKRRIVLI